MVEAQSASGDSPGGGQASTPRVMINPQTAQVEGSGADGRDGNNSPPGTDCDQAKHDRLYGAERW